MNASARILELEEEIAAIRKVRAAESRAAPNHEARAEIGIAFEKECEEQNREIYVVPVSKEWAEEWERVTGRKAFA